MMMKDLWTVFCGRSSCANDDTQHCGGNLELFVDPSSCVNHATIISFDIFLLGLLLSTIVWRISSPKVEFVTPCRRFSTLQVFSAAFNGCLGVVFIGLGAWNLRNQLKNEHFALPLNWWLLFFIQGLTSLLVGSIVSLRGMCLPKVPVRALSIFAFLFAGFSCFFALLTAVVDQERTTKIVLDIISFLGASLLLLCTYKGYKYEVTSSEDINRSTLYTPLTGETNDSSNIDSPTFIVTPFAKAGVFSRMSFWWLNSLVKLGREKALEEEDIPKIRDEESAKYCYLEFMDQFNKQNSSILWAIVACHRREIIISGIFALLKILTVSAGPLLLNAFIEVAEGKESFKYQGYLLAFSLFISKILESVSERQWYFRSKTIGLKVRSLLTALIYKKQLRLSNTAKIKHSSGEIVNYVNVDAYRIGEFPFWLHQTWTTSLQLCIALVILINSVGLATIASLIVIILTVLCNTPLAKFQLKYQSKLMVAQDERLKATSEALVNMKVLKLYAWETHFRNVIEVMREKECYWLSKVQLRKAYNGLLFWTSPVLVSVATFGACYFLGIPLHASNVFTFVATLRLVQDPIRAIPEVISAVIQAKVAFARLVQFLEAPEIKSAVKSNVSCSNHAVLIKSANLSWEMNASKSTVKNINLDVRLGQKVAICGEVGSGKSTLLAAILGEVPHIQGNVEVFGRIAYVSQTAWIQTGTIRDNILFGSSMDELRYQETLRRCSLVKDFELLPDGDMTEIGERGVNLSGGQKQRVQLARALYQDADIYLLDDPFSAVDAQTATSLFTEYVVEALSKKTVLLVTHQVDFLPAFNCCLLISNGEILQAGPYAELLASSQEFSDLVNANRETATTKNMDEDNTTGKHNYATKQVQNTNIMQPNKASNGIQLIKREEREFGDTGLKPYFLYLSQNRGYFYFSLVFLTHLTFIVGQVSQNSWMASNVDNPQVRNSKLIVVYLVIGFMSTLFLPARSFVVVTLGLKASKSICTQLLNSLFRAPMSFYDCTPLGRVLTRVSSDLSILDLDVPFSLLLSLASTMMTYANLVVLGVITWQVLFVSVPVIYMAIRLQRYYFATAKELMRINGTTKSLVANHLAESIAGAVMIRAFDEEERFFSKNLDLIDSNSSPFFHNFAASEWLIQRLETLCAFVLATAATCMVFLPAGTFSSGFIGMALSYGLSLNGSMVFSIQKQCTLANQIISMERLHQYMHIESEAPEVIEDNRPPQHWPLAGKVDIHNLQIRYRPDSPLVLRGITCTFEGGDKIGIVGRTGSGKTTLIGALFGLVEPVAGKITVDGLDICSIGLHDLRSRFGIIPQDPTLFNGTVRFNLDPLCQHTDEEIWEVLSKCQLKEVVDEKEKGLDSLVVEDGSNWSMGQRQLFCLGRALLRRSRILVLDEATASIDNATDMILQKTIRIEFAKCTVITVAHRIPTVMDSTKVLAISDGRLVEYDEPAKLMKKDDSLFSQLVKEYWSHIHFAEGQ